MGPKITAVRVQRKRDSVVITAIGQSPRGTKVRLRQAEAAGLHGPKQEFEANVEAAINQVISEPA